MRNDHQEFCSKLRAEHATVLSVYHIWETQSLGNKHLTIATKVSVYDACVLSLHLNGIETCKSDESMISAFHVRCLRSITGVPWKDEMTNEELLRLTRSDPLSPQDWKSSLGRSSEQNVKRTSFNRARN